MAYYIPIIKKCPKCFDEFVKQHIPQMECTAKKLSLEKINEEK